ncbi:MAG: hypothetical protein K6F83_06425 [Clostridiales bacterium]|nr:hypothetical protein [Clostridiales bacterium]
MNIEPKHDYKKPLYIAGIATVLGTTMLLGAACGKEDVARRHHHRSSGRKTVETTGEPELMGEAQIDDDYLLYGGDTEPPATDLQLSGATTIVTDVDYEGGLEIAPEYTEDIDEEG